MLQNLAQQMVQAGHQQQLLKIYGDTRSKRSPKKSFVLLDMYEIMRELHSEIEAVFKGKACTEIRESTFGLTKRLAQTAQETPTRILCVFIL